MNKVYDLTFHDWIYIENSVDYYGDNGLNYSDQIHFVREKGHMDSRDEDLLQIAIL